MAHTVSEIRSIEDIKCLPGGHPVFFIRTPGFSDFNMVVKAESRHGLSEENCMASVHWSSKLMKNAQHQQVNTKILKAEELSLFRRVVNERLSSVVFQ